VLLVGTVAAFWSAVAIGLVGLVLIVLAVRQVPIHLRWEVTVDVAWWALVVPIASCVR
jgi:hypothetical protein